MGSFGERLRREREMRKVSLEEIAAATKIGTRHLRALEEEDFKKLPGGIFNKGFIRSYARFLGINEDQAVSDYLVAAGEPENQTSEIIVDQLAAHHEAEKKAKSLSRELETINRSETGIPWGAIVALVVIVAAVAGGYTWYTHYKSRVETERAQDAQRAQSVQPAPTAPITSEQSTTPSTATQPQETANAPVEQAPAAQQPSAALNQTANAPATSATTLSQTPTTQLLANTTPSLSESASTASPTVGFVVSIRATKPAWISVTADGKHLMNLTLTPSDAKSIRAHSRILLTTGNAGGVEISFNGKPIPPLGGDGEVRKATFTAEGIQQ